MKNRNAVAVMRFAAAAIFCLFGFSSLSAENPITPVDQSFSWDDSRVDVGYLYRYVFTDMKGRGPIEYYLYMSGEREYQQLYNQYQSKYSRSISLMTIKIDAEALCPVSMRFDNLMPDVDKSFRYYDEAFDQTGRKMKYTGVEIKKGKDVPVKGEQAWEPNAYTANAIGEEFLTYFRHVKDDVAPFTLRYQDTLGRKYAMDCRYEKDETVDGIPCRKYLIEGQGALAKAMNVKGGVWLAKDDPARYMVKHTMNMRVEWEHDSTMVILKERRKASPEEWAALQREVVDKQKASLAF